MSHLNIALDRYASYRHCNALQFGNKLTGDPWKINRLLKKQPHEIYLSSIQ